MKHLVVVIAGIGSPSSSRLLGDRLTDATVASLAHGGWAAPEVTVLELRDLAVDLATLYTAHVPSKKLQEAFDVVAAASGMIAVSPVLNAGVNGLFKLFFDLLNEGALRGRPVLMAATGGTARHCLAIDNAMLPMFFYMKALVAPSSVFAAKGDWGSTESGLARRIERAAYEFAELLTAWSRATPDPSAHSQESPSPRHRTQSARTGRVAGPSRSASSSPSP